MGKIILHLCADVGSDSYFYKTNGYDVRLIGKDIGVENYEPPENVHGIIANPVCTDFSFAKYLYEQDEERGMFLVNHCIRIIEKAKPKFWVIENPATGKLKNFIGKPNVKYHPWHFGSPWTKGTALWGKFNMPEKLYTKWADVPKNDELYIRPGRDKPNFAFLHKSAIHKIEEFKPFIDKVHDDSGFRSLCSQGFAEQFYLHNK